jgi:hypothetical protein
MPLMCEANRLERRIKMWSLPDIVRLNAEAAQDARQHRLEKEIAHPQEHSCEVCGWDGKETSADYGYLWFDIFSDDPKGAIFVCEEHDGYTGSPMEGYFQCGECDRVFIENYTWEYYSTIVECEQLCLPCALKRHLEDDSNWIDPSRVREVVIDPTPDWDEVFDPETGVLNLARTKHLIGVEMPLPDAITFITNLEFDSGSGRLLATTSTTYPGGTGEQAALEAIQELAEEGYTRFLPILDAGYQFAISIGLYVNSIEHEAIIAGEKLSLSGEGL